MDLYLPNNVLCTSTESNYIGYFEILPIYVKYLVITLDMLPRKCYK